MVNSVAIALSLLGGLIFGLLYFGGLWWTVQHLQSARNPVGIYFVSLIFRLGIFLACLAFILHIDVLQMLAAFLGFVLARLALTRWISLGSQPEIEQKNGAQ